MDTSLTIPTAGVLGGLVDMFIILALLIVLMGFFGIVPTAAIIFPPLFILLAIATALGVNLWLSALNVQYRDVGYLLPFIVQLSLCATPVVYPSTLISEQYRVLYGLNPMAGVVEGFRWALFGASTPPGPMMLVSVLVVLFLLVSGAFFFRRMEKTFADVI